ncbi:MAG: nucleotidyltransferase [Hapalosiphonaceae cyanobacterium JJU2]|nr:MAG: nucleotidyltransferase [Hapalosiphonaceae cyanobacterium JJU2]
MQTLRRTDALFLSRFDRILESICRKLQLTPTQYELAKSHYEAVGKWLEHESSILAPYRPVMYPQGSLPMGTTNKPINKEEYDLDFICELLIDWWTIRPIDLLSKVEYRIGQHADYASRMERGNRCIRLTYAHNFHLDIVPACSNNVLGEGQIRIPDREKKGWKDSNSRAYIQWFNQQAQLSCHQVDHAEPLPLQETLEEKPALKCAVQLLKRHRDVAFKDKPDIAPASIVLSTLAAMHYQGQESVGEAIAGILQGIAISIAQQQGKRLQVWNPANNVAEDLGERWENPEAYNRFVAWIADFNRLWQELSAAQGYLDISRLLERLFDEQPHRVCSH